MDISSSWDTYLAMEAQEMEDLYKPNCIRTFSGEYIDVFDPQPEQIKIEDIAHALSNQCRFGGHLKKFYSVAQHCVMCYQSVEVEHKFAALMHDASEAYLLDIPTPIKRRLDNYLAIEDKLMTVISEVIGFKYPYFDETIKTVDKEMLEFEWYNLIVTPTMTDGSPINIECWPPEYAKARFLEAYNEISYYENSK